MTPGEGSGWTCCSLHTVPLHTPSEGHVMSPGLGIRLERTPASLAPGLTLISCVPLICFPSAAKGLLQELSAGWVPALLVDSVLEPPEFPSEKQRCRVAHG